jgi:prolipoprotein diacylglyceryltransferase
LYELIAALVFGAVAIWLLRRRDGQGAPLTPSGVPFLAFALGFTLFRLGNNFLRAQLPTIATPAWFYPVFYSVICAGVAALLVWRLRRHAPKEEKVS